MATLKDVAAAAGVHYATVSAILNGSRGNSRYSAETQRRVRAAARRLGYTRAELAEALRTGRSSTIGCVLGDVRNPFFAELAAAIERRLAPAGYRLLLARCADLPEPEEEARGGLVQALLGRGVDGVLVWSEGEAVARAPGRDGRPVVGLGLTRRGGPGAWIDLDRAHALAVDHFQACGARSIGYFAPEEIGSTTSLRLRERAFRRRARAAGLEVVATARYAGRSWDLAASVRGARAALEAGPAVDAFMPFNDVAALGLIMAQQDRPRPIPVLSTDGTALCRALGAAAIDLDVDALAAAAVDALAAARDGRPAPGGVRIAPRLVPAAARR
jgi:LacI family transcriptional regulator